MRTFTMTVDGVAVSSPTTFDVIDPTDETVLASAPECTDEQLDHAVAAARKAFPAWAATPFAERQAALIAMADVVDANADELHRLVTAEQGKPLAMAAAVWPG